ncbi:hypothetical protein BDN70DRAFT_730084 [Pholiota conissans]|uniref:Uncharacterized protein n=1 Tax=Pholiota conissans TaxID=109636 RepID=A0A9P5YMF4_9AGAR|nr:hypothetical protein BDN70DRAFT_730084 [Pholiota conissans]
MSFYKSFVPLSSFPSFQSRCITFFEDGQYYTSPNQNTLLKYNAPTKLCTKPSPTEMRSQGWCDDRYPYLSFIFLSPFFGHAMKRFAPFGLDTVEQSSSGWHLRHDEAKSWKSFEQSLRKLADRLTAYLAKIRPDMHPIWEIPQNPSAYGYFSTHGSAAQAYQCARLSADGFVIYTAYVSFLIVILRFVRHPTSPISLDALLKECRADAHPGWVKNLLSSGIGDTDSSERRNGVVVDINGCSWLNLVPFMISARIPIWFYWGTPPFGNYTGSWVTCFAPSFHSAIHTQPVTPTSTTPLGETACSHPAQITPKDRQLPGETMLEFFRRRKSENEEIQKAESVSARNGRLHRAEINKDRKRPTNRITKVYRWVEVDGKLTRTRVFDSGLKACFKRYSLSEIKYDAFSDEFDCSSEIEDSDDENEDESDFICHIPPQKQSRPLEHLAPNATLRSLDQSPARRPELGPELASSETLHSSLTLLPGTPLQEIAPVETQTLLEVTQEDVVNCHPISSYQDSPPPVQYGLEDLVYERYGFTLDEEPYSGIPSSCNIREHFKDWTSACRGVGGQDLESTSTQRRQPIIDFLNILCGVARPLHEVPSKYWDLSPGNLYPLHHIDTFHLDIEIKQFENETLCLLHPRNFATDDQPAWLLAVSPMTALECIRRQLGPDPFKTALYFTRHGIRFRTLQCVIGLQAPSSSQQTRVAAPATLLGTRSAKYKFHLADYASYEILSDSFLISRDHARSALMIGGIVARLARAVLSHDLVLSGPSRSALRGERCRLVCGDEVYVDDELSAEEKDLICGTYQRDSNLNGRYSWYPRHGVWEMSGLNVGHWNKESEEFFLKCRAQISSGEGDVHTGEQWRSKMRLTRGAVKILSSMDKSALAYLETSMASQFLYHK